MDTRRKHQRPPIPGVGGPAAATAALSHPTAELALRTARTVNRLSRTLKDWFGFYDGYRPEFAWWMRKPYDEAQKQMEAYAKLLREEIAGQKARTTTRWSASLWGPRRWRRRSVSSGCRTRRRN